MKGGAGPLPCCYNMTDKIKVTVQKPKGIEVKVTIQVVKKKPSVPIQITA